METVSPAPLTTGGVFLARAVQWDVMLSRDGQSALDALLFPRGAFLERGSALHRDFGEFFERYVAFRKKELARGPRGTELEPLGRPQSRVPHRF